MAWSVPPRIPLRQLVLAFAGVGLSGFGGVLPWARRMLVERRRWLSEREFVELIGLCAFLPGGNVINLAVCFGAREHGAKGAFACVVALLAGPFAIVLTLAELYGRYGGLPAARGALAGVSAAAAGLVVATAIRLARATPLVRRPWAAVVAIAVFAAVGLLRLPLVWVVLVATPVAIALAWRRA